MGHVESEFCEDQMCKSQGLCQNSAELDVAFCEEAKKAIVEPALGPITPDANKENGDFPVDLTSPLTVTTKLPKVLTFDSETDKNQDSLTYVDDSSSPKTPKDGVFDPFAPGPDDKVWAPQCKKYFDEARISVARRLNFSTSFKGFSHTCLNEDAESISDGQMFESVYENLLEAIVSKQTESILSELSNVEWDSDACTTPPSAPRLNGVAETCPGAPLKPTGKSRAIDLGLRRKLEFQL